MTKKIKFKKKETKSEWLKKKTTRGVIIIFSLMSSIIYVLVSIFAGKIQDIAKPYLQSNGYPEVVYSSFTLYATIFIAISYINKNIFKKIADLESSLDEEEIDESVLEDIKNIEQIKRNHASEVASLKDLVAAKDSMINTLIKERQTTAGMEAYNALNNQSNNNTPPLQKSKSAPYNVKYSSTSKYY